MKHIKKIALAIFMILIGVSISSCQSKETRNTTTPYGSLNLDSTIATSYGDISLDLNTYYTRLRSRGYDVFTESLRKAVYAKEISAIKALISSTSFNDLDTDTRKTLAFNSFDDVSNNVENEIDNERYLELKKIYEDSLSNSILNSIYSSTDAYTINSRTEEENNTSITRYIETMARTGYTIAKENISWTDVDGTAKLNLSLIPTELIDSLVLTQAENFYAQKKLYTIADQEYLYEGTDEEERNNNYLFTETSIPTNYNSTYKTYGTYKAIIITFNSRREATNAMSALGTDITTDNALSTYLALYNAYYSAYGVQDETSERFEYVISEDENELSEISSSVNTLITETLEDGEFLTEPRNLNNKYVLAYRISTEYDYEEKDYEDLDSTVKAELDQKIKNRIIRNSAGSYVNTSLQQAIEESELEIYDPLFEYRFYNSYTDYYDLIDPSNSNIGKNLIFKYNDVTFTVEDFYAAASKRYGSTLLTEYFELEYAFKYYDDFVDSDTNDANIEALDTAISEFEKGNNTSYPKEIGLETFLINSYGYSTRDNIIKYYYQATTCLNSYRSQVLFDEWATEGHEISDEAEKVLNRILEVGNKNYSELFSINVDHILINIDYDADGTPDDPDLFMSKLDEQTKSQFESDVEALAKAIYTEATHSAYADNTLYETLNYIVKQFNKGDTVLVSNENATWNDYKTNFNFLLTAEQLASSGDITQDSVSSFVTPFADYITEMYKTADDANVSLSDNGDFFLATEGKLTSTTDADKITKDSLCKTVYGYHLIVLNDYDGPDTLKFTADNDPNSYQAEIQVLISEDEDDSSNNVYVTLNSYNESTTQANLNQLFIYYVQTRTGASSSLDSNISTLLSTLFTDAISQYTSSNFQNMILLDLLDIQSDIAELQKMVEVERGYYANQVISYDQDSDYITWISPETDWTRPNKK